MNYKSQGFTLIELLVVIAIIGILSAVVLASLGTARTKGQDASARQSLEGARAQGELFFYANGNSYSGVCSSAIVGGVKPINGQVLAAAQAEGLGSFNPTYTTAGTNITATCHENGTAWAAEVPLKVIPPTNPMFCVDSTGVARIESGPVPTSLPTNAACP